MNVRYRWASLGCSARVERGIRAACWEPAERSARASADAPCKGEERRLVIRKQATSGPLPNPLPLRREREQTLQAFCFADAMRPKETQPLQNLIQRGLPPNAAPASLRS